MEELGAGAPRGREPGGGGGKDGAKEGRTNGPSEGGGFGFIYSRGSLFIFYFLWGFGELSPSFSRCVQARRPMAGLGAGAEALGRPCRPPPSRGDQEARSRGEAGSAPPRGGAGKSQRARGPLMSTPADGARPAGTSDALRRLVPAAPRRSRSVRALESWPPGAPIFWSARPVSSWLITRIRGRGQ